MNRLEDWVNMSFQFFAKEQSDESIKSKLNNFQRKGRRQREEKPFITINVLEQHKPFNWEGLVEDIKFEMV